MSPERTPELFDAWAENYDYWIEISRDSFPFRGYDEVLDRIVDLSNGTGNLALKFVEFDCEIWGIDYSSRMLEKAMKKVPDVHLHHVDVESAYPAELKVGFDSIVSAYTLHHLTLERKVTAIKRLSSELLLDGGCIVVGDISFPTSAARDMARVRLGNDWDDYEYYWAADAFIAKMSEAEFQVTYDQVSDYGGVYKITPGP
ncbi:MAG: class I SAM-dependent methyltransferase [Candidatus Thorarchaeota archaeon]|jgi:putative AdoMet-dependent methyltransferase